MTKMKNRCLTSTLLLTIASAASAGTHRRPLQELLDHRVFSESIWQRQNQQLQIATRQAGGVAILDLKGGITKGPSSEALRLAVADLTRKGHNKILLNLAKVTAVDSAGIGVMVSSYTTVIRNAGQFKLLNLTTNLKDLLAITKLLTVFDVYETEAEALKSFSSGPAQGAEQKGTLNQKTGEQTPPSKAAACLTDSAVEAVRIKINRLISDELGVDIQKVLPEARFIQDLGIDSLDAVELVMRIEEAFKIEIPEVDADKLQRVSDVYCYVEKHATIK